MNEDDDLSPELIPLILLFILLVYTIIMNGFTSDAVLYVAIAVWIAICGWFLKYCFYPNYTTWKDKKNEHLEIISDTLRRTLAIASIHYANNFSANIMIQTGADVYSTIEKSQELRWTLEHLRKYPQILNNWNLSNTKIEQLKSRLKKLEEYLPGRIERELEQEYVKDISYVIGAIIQNLLEHNIDNLDDINFTIKNEDVRLAIEYNSGGVFIPNKDEYNEDDILNFLNNLIDDNGFEKELVEIQNINDDTNEKFNNFKSNLENLISDLSRDISLKGKCKGCTSYWKT